MLLRIFPFVAAVLALLAAPAGMASSGVMAHGRAVASAPAAHCDGHETPEDDQAPERMMSCATACSALPAPEAVLEPAAASIGGKAPLAKHQILIGVPPEGETPPPRIPPEI